MARIAYLTSFCALLLQCSQSSAQADENLAAAYQQAEQLLPWNSGKLAINHDLEARWIAGSDRLWLKLQNETGWEFLLADPATQSLRPAFDHAAMAEALNRATVIEGEEPLVAERLPLADLQFTDSDMEQVQVSIPTGRFRCGLVQKECLSVPASNQKPGRAYAPNGRYAVFAKGPDLWVEDIASGTERPLSTDGSALQPYGAIPQQAGLVTRSRNKMTLAPVGEFSPDGERFASFQLDESAAPELTLLQYLPDDGSLRPVTWSFRQALPPDSPITGRLVIFELSTAKQVEVEHPPSIVQLSWPVAFEQLRWSADSLNLYFVDYRDSFRTLSLFRADGKTGKTEELITESAKTNQFSYMRPGFVLLDSGEILWPSQRSGWEQLYRYTPDGRLLNAVTQGEWVVREILRVDENDGNVYLAGAGREAGVDPYLRQIYRADLDGGQLRLLTPEPADHEVNTFRRQYFVRPGPDREGFSSTGRYFIDAYSRPDLPTVTVIRNAQGKVVMELATAHLTAAGKAVYTLPETFSVLAADGETKVWGTLFKPSNFDPSKRYPVIDAMYGGPQSTFVPKRFLFSVQGLFGHYLAELGFIVINVDGRGTPLRSRAFQDASWGQLGNAGQLDDHLAAIRELAAGRRWMDAGRLGVFGYSGGGYAVVHALFDYPDDYSVGVAISPYDPLLTEWSWGEKFMGPYDEAAYRAQASYANAEQFSGHLMLATGDIDEVAHPAGTMAIVKALMEQNQDFDLLLVPNGGHDIVTSPYVLRRSWDYFVRHLLGVEPPPDYRIKAPGAG